MTTDKDQLVEKYINIVNKMAYSFCKTTGHDFEDLRSEGICGMLRAINRFDESLGTQLSTVIHISAKNAMINYIERLGKNGSTVEFFDVECRHLSGQQRLEFLDSLNHLGIEARQIARIIFLAPTAVLGIAKDSSPTRVRNALKQKMRDLGYTKKQIELGIAEIKSVLQP